MKTKLEETEEKINTMKMNNLNREVKKGIFLIKNK